MEFDKSKVYTALNANELEEGDVVFAADTLSELKQTTATGEIFRIRDESTMYRFDLYNCGGIFTLAYLIAKHDDPYKEFKKAQAEGKEVWHLLDGEWYSNTEYGEWPFDDAVSNYSLTKHADEYCCFLDEGPRGFVFGPESQFKDKVVFAKFQTDWEANEWCTKHQKFTEVAKAWLNGKTIEFRSPATVIEKWIKIAQPSWNINTEYRVAPEEVSWEDFKLFDKVECRGFKQFVSGINPISPQYHIQLSVSGWLEDGELKYIKELED